jgi:hypothetical protein
MVEAVCGVCTQVPPHRAEAISLAMGQSWRAVGNSNETSRGRRTSEMT